MIQPPFWSRRGFWWSWGPSQSFIQLNFTRNPKGCWTETPAVANANYFPLQATTRWPWRMRRMPWPCSGSTTRSADHLHRDLWCKARPRQKWRNLLCEMESTSNPQRQLPSLFWCQFDITHSYHLWGVPANELHFCFSARLWHLQIFVHFNGPPLFISRDLAYRHSVLVTLFCFSSF